MLASEPPWSYKESSRRLLSEVLSQLCQLKEAKEYPGFRDNHLWGSGNQTSYFSGGDRKVFPDHYRYRLCQRLMPQLEPYYACRYHCCLCFRGRILARHWCSHLDCQHLVTHPWHYLPQNGMKITWSVCGGWTVVWVWWIIEFLRVIIRLLQSQRRFILPLDLHNLNRYITTIKFWMVYLASIIPSLDPRDQYAALDLQGCLLPCGNAPWSQEVLSAPRVFLKCMAVAVATFCKGDVHVYSYLDDWLVWGCFRHQILVTVHLTVSSQCTWPATNCNMSIFSDIQGLEFLGAVLDSTSARALLPLSRFRTLWYLCVSLKRHSQTTVKDYSRILDHMVVSHTKVKLQRSAD